MGWKKHKKGSAFGKAKLKLVADNVMEGDGCRFADDGGPRITHKGLPPKKQYRQRYRPDYLHDAAADGADYNFG